ncbi:IS110 family transposase [Rhizobium leguminosarum bv. viciae 248]|uniref:IS110 family transposase n=2 Tax=Rhizobium leguminosarum TaxID=384 RepID=UPI001397A1AE|nr:IS110 family transposase [Rhizobium leguminosarum]QHW25348.1 IS110 family transposase [Rhizobium leguminosarum bv. viciae 248]
MMAEPAEIQCVLGLDVSRNTVTLCDGRTRHTVTIANDADALRTALLPYQGTATLAVCEATGGHEDTLLGVLLELAIPAHRADPAKVKAYIKSFGKRAKNDPIDARWLSRYGRDRAATLPRWQSADPTQQKLELLVARRLDLVAMRVQEQNRLKAPRSRLIADNIRDHLAELERHIEALNAEIGALIGESRDLALRAEQLRSVPGVGPVLAPLLLAVIPELGTLNRRQVASLAGVAPHPKDSGKASWHRSTTGGRRQIRPALFIAALAACRGDNPLAAAYKALLKAAKPKRVALTAIMRKIITIANARVRDAVRHQNEIMQINA